MVISMNPFVAEFSNIRSFCDSIMRDVSGEKSKSIVLHIRSEYDNLLLRVLNKIEKETDKVKLLETELEQKQKELEVLRLIIKSVFVR